MLATQRVVSWCTAFILLTAIYTGYMYYGHAYDLSTSNGAIVMAGVARMMHSLALEVESGATTENRNILATICYMSVITGPSLRNDAPFLTEKLKWIDSDKWWRKTSPRTPQRMQRMERRDPRVCVLSFIVILLNAGRRAMVAVLLLQNDHILT